MHELKSRLLRYACTPPGTLWRKAVRRTKAATTQSVLRTKDQYRSSYSFRVAPGHLVMHLKTFPLHEARAIAETLQTLSEHYLAHRFDLLGSGWVTVCHDAECRGVEGHRHSNVSQQGVPVTDRVNSANRSESLRLWALLEDGYRPIDWQLDFKSGFRWREDCWYKDIAISTGCPGADIKVPWELARCQHLPQLALAYGLAKAGIEGFRDCAEYQKEFRNQIIDFIASNPPRFGVNWACPMDASIRVANWLMAYDLFVAAGATFDVAFEVELRRSVDAHGTHIAANLEWNEEFRSNHYLADLAGLLFAGAYLPNSAKSDSWIRTAAVELLIEIPEQYNEDGTNFEASTCYHRLSTEMVVYSVALIWSILRQRLPLPWHVPATRHGVSPTYWDSETQIFSRNIISVLERAGEFSMHVTREDGHVTQIGDNDSGRFFKLQPVGLVTPVAQVCKSQKNLYGYAVLRDDDEYFLEDSLDHRHLVGAVGALFPRPDLAAYSKPFALDAAVIRVLTGGRCFPSYRKGSQPLKALTVRIASDDRFTDIEVRLRALVNTDRQRYRFPLREPLRGGGIESFGYRDFGLFIFRGSGLYMAIRCGPREPAKNSSHAHHDQLAVELVVGAHAYALDPGTYLYTALPERRNEYRAAAAHFAPRVPGAESGCLAELFLLPDSSRAECLYFGPLGFIGRHRGYGIPVYRVVAIQNDSIEVRDYAEGGMLEACRFSDVTRENHRYLSPPFSAGYGLQSSTPMVT